MKQFIQIIIVTFKINFWIQITKHYNIQKTKNVLFMPSSPVFLRGTYSRRVVWIRKSNWFQKKHRWILLYLNVCQSQALPTNKSSHYHFFRFCAKFVNIFNNYIIVHQFQSTKIMFLVLADTIQYQIISYDKSIPFLIHSSKFFCDHGFHFPIFHQTLKHQIILMLST